jgi:Peptidogalycan biosysnthesis/recognition
LEIDIYNSITDCEAAWQHVIPPRHNLNLAELRLLENASLPNITPHYVVVKKHGQIIGLCYFQLFSFTKQHVANAKSFFTKCIVGYIPFKIPVLVCGNLLRINFEGFYFTDKKNNELIFDVIDLFLKQTKKCAAVLLKDCASMFDGIVTQKHSYSFFDGDVTMELVNQHWQSFDDYLAALQKKYLQRAKKILKQFEPVTTKALTAAEILQHKTTIEKLYNNVLAQQSIKLGTITIDYLLALKNSLSEKFELHALFVGDKMVGFYTYIFYEKTMETHFIGLDYEANKQYNLYFNILFASAKVMIDKGYLSLELGRTAREAKANLGAKPVQIFNYIKITNRFSQWLFTIFLKRFSLQENYKNVERNPFKVSS